VLIYLLFFRNLDEQAPWYAAAAMIIVGFTVRKPESLPCPD